MNWKHLRFGHSRLPQKSADQRAMRDELTLHIEGEMDRIRLIGEEWFDFRAKTNEPRGSFKGLTARDIYTNGRPFRAAEGDVADRLDHPDDRAGGDSHRDPTAHL